MDIGDKRKSRGLEAIVIVQVKENGNFRIEWGQRKKRTDFISTCRSYLGIGHG